LGQHQRLRTHDVQHIGALYTHSQTKTLKKRPRSVRNEKLGSHSLQRGVEGLTRHLVPSPPCASPCICSCNVSECFNREVVWTYDLREDVCGLQVAGCQLHLGVELICPQPTADKHLSIQPQDYSQLRTEPVSMPLNKAGAAQALKYRRQVQCLGASCVQARVFGTPS
jgi:hypothetical protein